MSALDDDDLMPFGKYQGYRMEEVPASYLHWLWVNGKKDDFACPVHQYIHPRMSALQDEYRDGIWN